MRLRRLQTTDDNIEWYDDAYAYEDGGGQVVFCYNLAWDRVGSHYNGKLQETGVSLDEIETVIEPNNDKLHWLPTEVIEEDQVESYLEALDEACAIPKSQPISMPKPVIA
jgi:hypothetical protein